LSGSFLVINTGLPGWRNGIRNMEISQPSLHDQRKGTQAWYPLPGFQNCIQTKKRALEKLFAAGIKTINHFSIFNKLEDGTLK